MPTSGAALAQTAGGSAFPVKPLRVVVPFPPGGGTDFVMRSIAPQLSESLGQQVLIDNRAGAQGVVGTQIGARANPDGYTLTIVDAATVIAPALLSPPPFDVMRDFAPIAILVEQPYLITVHPSVPATSMPKMPPLGMARRRILRAKASGVRAVNATAARVRAVSLMVLILYPRRGRSKTTPDA